MIPLPHGLGQLPGERVVLDVAARAPDGGAGLNQLRIPNWHDTGSINFIAPARPEKKSAFPDLAGEILLDCSFPIARMVYLEAP